MKRERSLHSLLLLLLLLLKSLQLCLTLCDPIDGSLPGSSVLGIPQARILEWVAIFSSRGIFPTQGSNRGLPHCRRILYCLSHQSAALSVLPPFSG